MAGLNEAQAPNTRRRAVFDRAQYFNQPRTKLLLEQFISLFHPYSYIYKPPKSPWLSAKDPRWKLSSSEIAKAIACQHYQFIGTRWGTNTRHAVLDIDANSRYHKKSALRQLLKTLEDAGLTNAVPYQSSVSGGWHIYIFFAENVLSRKTRDYLCKLLRIKGYVIKSGTLEVFPDPGHFNALGQGLRLPMQPGFAWLHPVTLEVVDERDTLSPAEALHKFMADLEENQHTQDDYRNFLNYVDHLNEVTEQVTYQTQSNIRQFQRLTPVQRTTSPDQLAQITEIFGVIPPNIIPERWLAGRQFAQTGLLQQSQRHEAELSLGHYYFYGDPSLSIEPLGYGYEDERQAVLTQIIFGKHNGLSKEINDGRSDVIADINRATHWLPQHMRGSDKIRQKRSSASVNIQHKLANIKRANQARAKIKQAVDKRLAENLPIRVSDLQKDAGVSKPTLYKHQDLWRKFYDQQHLAGSLGVISEGGGGVTPLNPAQQPNTEFEKPLEFLAARQIASEIRARVERARKVLEKQKMISGVTEEEKWHLQVKQTVDRLSEDITQTDHGVLKSVSATLRFLRGHSPHFEAEQLLLTELGKVTIEQQRRQALPITSVPSRDHDEKELLDFSPPKENDFLLQTPPTPDKAEDSLDGPNTPDIQSDTDKSCACPGNSAFSNSQTSQPNST